MPCGRSPDIELPDGAGWAAAGGSGPVAVPARRDPGDRLAEGCRRPPAAAQLAWAPTIQQAAVKRTSAPWT